MALRFEDMLERLGSQGRDAVLNTYRLYEAGLIDSDTFIEVASDLLQHINERGAVYGQLSYDQVRAILLDTAAELPATVTATASTSSGALAESLATILDGEQDEIERRLERLAYVLPMESTQDGYRAALRADRAARGWIRGLDANACELCQWWARDGRAWPKHHPMPTHKGCRCQQIPTYIDNPPLTYQQRILRRREQAIANRDTSSSIVRKMIETGELTA